MQISPARVSRFYRIAPVMASNAKRKRTATSLAPLFRGGRHHWVDSKLLQNTVSKWKQAGEIS
jgi:hypothetical protein